ncbi:MAG TPA: hypothetical protein VNT42_12205 [Sphingomonas sp.]|nr:hypothetical protein [Sphingomonas sp.]
MQQARRHAGDETGTRFGYERQSCPQRVAGGGVRIDVERVEKQVGAAVSRQMIGQRGAGREDEPARVDPPACGFAPQIPGRPRIVLQQPQDAPFDSGEQTHPDVEFDRGNLVIVIEAAKNERLVRQAEIGTGYWFF